MCSKSNGLITNTDERDESGKNNYDYNQSWVKGNKIKDVNAASETKHGRGSKNVEFYDGIKLKMLST